jgi:hypothetical protein
MVKVRQIGSTARPHMRGGFEISWLSCGNCTRNTRQSPRARLTTGFAPTLAATPAKAAPFGCPKKTQLHTDLSRSEAVPYGPA